MDKKKVVIETLPILLLCALGGGLAGYILGSMKSVFEILPGLIALVPAIIGMRGNISSTMGSRLGSAVHLGLVDEGITSDTVIENLKSSISLSLYVSLLLPIFFVATALMVGFTLSIRFTALLALISITTGLTTSFVLSFLTFFIINLSMRFKIDPDNITGPLLTTVGDVITLLILFTYSVILGGIVL